MNLEHLKPGDEVCVCHGRWQDDPTYERATVARINKKTLTLDDGRNFSRLSGRLHYDKAALSQDIVEMTVEIRVKLGGR